MDKINNIPLSAFGASLSEGAYEALLTPPPVKDYIRNSSPLQAGSQYLPQTRTDEQQLSLPIHFTASSKEEFLSRYGQFCEVLSQGKIDLYVEELGLTFHLLYKSCNSYNHYFGGIAKFVLKVIEPNPTNRT